MSHTDDNKFLDWIKKKHESLGDKPETIAAILNACRSEFKRVNAADDKQRGEIYRHFRTQADVPAVHSFNFSSKLYCNS